MMTQIKSKERVRDLAEVFTNEREVKAMLDLIPMNTPDEIINYKYLEPACGNGNFLIEILRRKLRRINEKYVDKSLSEYQFNIAKGLSTIYGIDISPENVIEARNRLFVEIKSTFDLNKGSFLYTDGFLSFMSYILEKNIVIGDAINSQHKIFFSEYKFKGKKMAEAVFCFADLVDPKPLPVRIIQPENYLAIGRRYQLEKGIIHEGKQRHFEFI
jgi:hypothetical protein